jgi:serine/threonine kinase 16
MEMRAEGGDENVRSAKGTTSRADEDDETEQQRPLMTDDERLPAVVPGAMRSYAHRDIKPGESFFFISAYDGAHQLTFPPQQTS